MLKKRVLTAVVGLPLLLLAILLLPSNGFGLLIGFLMLLTGWEWSALAGLHKKLARVSYVIVILLCIFASAFVSATLLLWAALFVWLWILGAIIRYEQGSAPLGFQFSWVRQVAGVFVIVVMWAAIVMLRVNPNFGAGWLITVLLIVFAADTGAYFSGRFFGQKKLAPLVSPNKTVEGLMGGLVLALLVTMISGGFLVSTFKQYSAFIVAGLVAAVFSVVGDLSISLLKRIANVKDTGKLFPGHGGLLDRLDSVAAATVMFLFFAALLGL